MKEADLYEPVKGWLEDHEYEVFSEVSPSFTSFRADVVARRSPAITIVELKTTLSLELLDQAYRWKNYVNYIYIGIPYRKKRIPHIIEDFMRKNNIGVLEIDPKRGRVYQRTPARFNRPFSRRVFNWNDELLPEHKTFLKGGSAGGGYVTPYKLTINRVRDKLRRIRILERDYTKGKRPGGWLSIREILDDMETHYSAPKSSLSKALREFEYGWCETKKEKGRLYFRYKEELL